MKLPVEIPLFQIFQYGQTDVTSLKWVTVPRSKSDLKQQGS